LVVGDVIADVYRDCTFKKMCPDAPGVRALVTRSLDIRPGGAANVAVNLAALSPDTRIHLVGGIDVELARKIKQLSHNRVNMEHCCFWGEAITKERVFEDGGFVIRVDNMLEVPRIYAEDVEQHLKDYLAENDPDLIVLSDYGAGSVDTSWDILLEARERLLVDTKLSDLSRFESDGRRTKLIKLNWLEWMRVIEREAIPERFFDALVRTDGSAGAFLDMHEQLGPTSYAVNTIRAPAHVVPVVDVCGCGDTFMAGLAASLLKNDDYFTAMQFANAAAATVVTQARTSVADLGETLRLLGREEEDEAR
jgi:D-beta-D-heptose 7-phosphate kinase/D-beta-D-heptose 1-phosphate adenosyltransferase